MITYTIAVLITCHNRVNKTLSCLQKLHEQELPINVQIKIYLVDDGSTDGTKQLVSATYPHIKVILGTGNLYWSRGMHLAFTEAIKDDHDFYLWLNDDTMLYSTAISKLLQTFYTLTETGKLKSIIVGSTQDQENGKASYGGIARSSWWHPLKFRLLEPSNEIKPCLTMNGNCVLIPKAVVQSVGNLDYIFTHSTADVDYGLRAIKYGASIWIAPGFVGSCEYNPLRQQAWENPNLTLRERWEKINQPRGLPIMEWKVFSRRHAGAFWVFFWFLPYVRLIVKSVSYKRLKA